MKTNKIAKGVTLVEGDAKDFKQRGMTSKKITEKDNDKLLKVSLLILIALSLLALAYLLGVYSGLGMFENRLDVILSQLPK